jgi:hypothetical protein
MSTFDGSNYYFSGQGVVLIGNRDSSGKAAGLIPVGNVSALKLGLASTVIEHKESQTGNRAIDLRLITELKSSLQMTIENFSANGLASALTGDVSQLTAGTVTTGSETAKLYMGKVTPMQNINVSAVVVKRNGGTPQTLTMYTNDATPWDYKLNAAAGSVMINDGSVTAIAALTTGMTTTAPTGVTVSTAAGQPTTFTWAAIPPSNVLAAGVGGYIAFTGFAGADAALINAKAHRITAIDTAARTVKVATDTFGKTITLGTPVICVDTDVLDFAYNYTAQNRINAMTSLTTEKYLRFEGLNTADGGNPVIVEVFRMIVDPLKELALIGEGVGPFVLDGNVLSDPLQSSGSKFFKVTQLR